MKMHKGWRLTSKTDPLDTFTYRRDIHGRQMIDALKRDGELGNYKVERVFILR